MRLNDAEERQKLGNSAVMEAVFRCIKAILDRCKAPESSFAGLTGQICRALTLPREKLSEEVSFG